ncbi:MAG: type II secretion system F family protein [Actinobacteria bacterium]|nr:type II secretion system F family protein [Actinomycetota bacterium]MCG2819963.1 type II secretion system F family protein [Actinomycetes bacterium]MBU4179228.1 type II secretion system F family protein [Actinomycetota bacterium]MBU4218944.1 type II secretion system F family protein [Actinomycetota bacterium]MBU4357963.1 type II secretion system F family protein [Actinomycetota bacterium]
MANAYTYTVRDRTGREITGSLEAENVDVLSGKLRQMGYFVVSIEEAKISMAKKELHIFGAKVKGEDVTIFTRQFATMINAGLPLIKCLSVLAQQTDSKTLADVIVDCQKDVEAGRSLSEALSKHPEAFSNLYVSMVRAGELGGMLDDVLLRVANQMEREQEIRRKIKSAMTYPIAVLAITLLLLTAMIVFVVPNFAGMFEDMGGELPTFTKMLVSLSHFVGGFGGLIMIAVIIGLVIGFRRFKATATGRMAVDRLKLHLPMVGPLFHKTAMSKFSRTLGTLLSSGVPILGALEITGETTGNMVVTKALDKVKDGVKEGETIAAPLAQAKVFPPMVTQMIAIGEETGALDVMLAKVSEFYDSEVNAAVDGLTSTIEPLLIMFLGLAVGTIVIALYLPIFRVITMLK